MSFSGGGTSNGTGDWRHGARVPDTEDAQDDAQEYISNAQIEQLALRAVTRFASLEPEEASGQWRRWRAELFRRLPVYAAEEVVQRTDEMRGLVRHGTR